MGYDLIPIKKEYETISFGAFTWPFMLQETGAGYVLGYGEGRTPGSYVYTPRQGSPVSNDGFKVTASEARMMATIIRGYISVNRFINKEWEEEYPDEARRKKIQESVIPGTGKHLYRTGMAESRMKELEKFCDFAEKSGGFKIT